MHMMVNINVFWLSLKTGISCPFAFLYSLLFLFLDIYMPSRAVVSTRSYDALKTNKRDHNNVSVSRLFDYSVCQRNGTGFARC